MKLLTHFFDSLLLIGSSYTDSRIYKLDSHGFTADSQILAADVRVVGSDIRTALKKAESYVQTYQVKAQHQNGNSLQLTQHETDSPVLPVAQLEQLHAFRPDLVDWVKNQTEQEALHRRARVGRVDTFILIERLLRFGRRHSHFMCGFVYSRLPSVT